MIALGYPIYHSQKQKNIVNTEQKSLENPEPPLIEEDEFDRTVALREASFEFLTQEEDERALQMAIEACLVEK